MLNYQRFALLSRELNKQLQKNDRLVEKLEYDASHDSMTGLLNRRRACEMVKCEYLKAEREPAFVTVMSIDIDYFKKINDTWGHIVGGEEFLVFTVGASR